MLKIKQAVYLEALKIVLLNLCKTIKMELFRRKKRSVV